MVERVDAKRKEEGIPKERSANARKGDYKGVKCGFGRLTKKKEMLRKWAVQSAVDGVDICQCPRLSASVTSRIASPKPSKENCSRATRGEVRAGGNLTSPSRLEFGLVKTPRWLCTLCQACQVPRLHNLPSLFGTYLAQVAPSTKQVIQADDKPDVKLSFLSIFLPEFPSYWLLMTRGQDTAVKQSQSLIDGRREMAAAGH